MSSTFGSTSPATQPAQPARPAQPEQSRGSTNRFDQPSQHREGEVARTIEQQTAKMPSDWFLWAAIGSIATSLAFQMANRKETSNFIGQWAPTLLILGLYNKIVKVAGSDAEDMKSRMRQS
jgi:hypothetical protein